MPEGYEKLRSEIACTGMEHENLADMYKSKIAMFGGMNFISPDNINSSNKNRVKNFRNYVKDCYPYVDIGPDSEERQQNTGSLESIIEDYKKIFGDSQNKQK